MYSGPNCKDPLTVMMYSDTGRGRTLGALLLDRLCPRDCFSVSTIVRCALQRPEQEVPCLCSAMAAGLLQLHLFTRRAWRIALAEVTT